MQITATDCAGNSTTGTIIVNLVDITKPTAVCQAVTVQLNASGTATITPAQVNNGSSDNCTDANQLTFALSKTSFDCSEKGSNSVTLTVTDLAGNFETCTATITVQDLIAPTITAPANITAQNANAGFCYATGVSLGTPTTGDNCSVASVVAKSDA